MSVPEKEYGSGKPGKRRERKIIQIMRLLNIAILLFLGVVFIVSTLVITRRTRRDYDIREAEMTVNNVTRYITAGIDTYKEISRMIMLNEGVTSFLRAEQVDVWLENDARDGAVSVLNVCRNVDSVFIFRNDGSYVITGKSQYEIDYERMKQPEWKDYILDRRGGAVIVMNGNGAVFSKNGEPIITIARAIYDIYTQKQTGILLMNISNNMFSNIVKEQTESDVCILVADGTALVGNSVLGKQYCSDYNSLSIVSREVKTESGRRTIAGCGIEGMPFVVLGSPNTGSEVIPGEIISIMVVLLLSFLVSLLVSGALVMRHLNQPIMKLAEAMKKTEESGWLERLDLDIPNNEVGILMDSYNSMIDHLNDLFSRIIENEKAVQKAELRVLYEQMKPHFLYNSLEAISYMAMEAGADDVRAALETLGSFYRNFLSKGSRVIPLQSEIKIIQDYLSLQKLRYGGIIRDEYEIDEACLDYMVPKLILQPLVENSIYHGIKLKGEDGVIRITAQLAEDDVIRIAVRDTGVGMTDEEIEKVLRMVNRDSVALQNGSMHGFGLSGTIERLHYYSGREDVLQIQSVPGEYTEIVILLPATKEVIQDVQSDGY